MINEKEHIIDIDKKCMTEEEFLQKFKDDYNYIKSVIQISHYSITWNELLNKFDTYVAQGLLEKSPIKTGKPHNLLFLACAFDDLDLGRWAITNSADTNITQLESRNTALHLTAKNGNTKLAKLLIKKGAYISCVNAEGSTPLHLAAKNGHLEYIIEIIIEATNQAIFSGFMIDFGDQNIEGSTALHLAVQNLHYQCIQYLLEYKLFQSSINKRDREGNTALHLAVLHDTDIWLKKREIIMLLLEKSDDLTINSAYDCAKNYNDIRVLKVFQNSFLRQEKCMKKNYIKFKKQASHYRDYVLYAANLSMVIETFLTLYQKSSEFLQNEPPEDFALDSLVILSKFISLLTIPFMAFAYQKHRKLDSFNKILENYQTKIDEIGELNKEKIVVDAAGSSKAVQARSYSAADMYNNYLSKSYSRATI